MPSGDRFRFPVVDLSDLSSIMRQNMFSAVDYSTIVDLRTRHSSFMIGGEIVTVNLPSSSNPKFYHWVAANLSTDDGENIIKPNNLSSTTAGRWRKIGHQMLQATGTWDPGSIADGAVTSTTLAVTGAALGDPVSVSHSAMTAADIILTAFVQAADTVRIVLFNKSGGNYDMGTGTLTAIVTKK